MCHVSETAMACGHKLQHTSSYCHNAAQPSSSSNPSARTTCANPEVTHRSSINDTCAECDPAVRRRILRMRYEEDRAVLMRVYMDAKKAGDQALMARVEEMMNQAVSEVRAGNFAVSVGAWRQSEAGGKTEKEREEELDVTRNRDG
jgi:hypothetical protein